MMLISCKGWVAVLACIASLWGPVSALGGDPAGKRDQRARVDFQDTWPVDAEVTAMDMGDLTGDGRNELVLAAGIEIRVYTLSEGRLKLLAGRTSYDRYRFMALDVADENGDGRAEIYASRFNEKMASPTSMVFELRGGELVPLVKNFDWFFRVMHWPGKGKILLGQQKGRPGDVGGSGVIRDFFERRIYRLAWKGGALAAAECLADLSEGGKRSVYLYNFALGDLNANGSPEMIWIDREGRMKVMDAKAEVLARSDGSYLGVAGYIWTNPGWEDRNSRSIRQEYLYIPPRLLIRDLKGDGSGGIIACRNGAIGTPSRLRSFITDGGIVALALNGPALVVEWETTPVGGNLADYTVKDLDNDGRDDLVAVILKERKSGLFNKGKSVVVSRPFGR